MARMEYQKLGAYKTMKFLIMFTCPFLLYLSCGRMQNEIMPEIMDQVCEEEKSNFQGKILFVSGGSILVLENQISSVIKAAEVGQHRSNPRWSPDGKYIAYDLQDGYDNFLISIIHSDGRRYKTYDPDSNSFGYLLPTWSPDGEQIAYCRHQNTKFSIRVVSLKNSVDSAIITLDGSLLGYDWSPDGSRFVISFWPDSSSVFAKIIIIDVYGAILYTSATNWIALGI